MWGKQGQKAGALTGGRWNKGGRGLNGGTGSGGGVMAPIVLLLTIIQQHAFSKDGT